MKPVIIEAAINGQKTKARNPHVPISPAEIVDDALACIDAGAAIIHSHNNDINLVGQAAADSYIEAYGPILRARPNAILCSTSVRGETSEVRVSHYAPLAHVMRMGIIDPGSLNFGTEDPDGVPAPSEHIYSNSYRHIRVTFDELHKTRLGPSIAIYEPGFLRATLAYHRAGALPSGALVKLYFGGSYNILDGTPTNTTFGLPPTRKALDAYLEMLDGSGLEWSVAVFGGDVVASGLARYAVECGGHLRIGLEDFGGARSPKNMDLVKEAVAVIESCGRSVADADAAAQILGLPR